MEVYSSSLKGIRVEFPIPSDVKYSFTDCSPQDGELSSSVLCRRRPGRSQYPEAETRSRLQRRPKMVDHRSSGTEMGELGTPRRNNLFCSDTARTEPTPRDYLKLGLVSQVFGICVGDRHLIRRGSEHR